MEPKANGRNVKRDLGVLMIIIGALLTIPVGIQLVKMVLRILDLIFGAGSPNWSGAFTTAYIFGYVIGHVVIVVGIVLLLIHGIRFAQGKTRE